MMIFLSDTRQQPCNTQCCVKWHTCDRSLASEGTNCVDDADFDEVYLPRSNLKEMIFKKSQIFNSNLNEKSTKTLYKNKFMIFFKSMIFVKINLLISNVDLKLLQLSCDVFVSKMMIP